jgi:aminopeptidase N
MRTLAQFPALGYRASTTIQGPILAGSFTRLAGLVLLLSLALLPSLLVLPAETAPGPDARAFTIPLHPEGKGQIPPGLPVTIPTTAVRAPQPDPRQELFDVKHYDIDLLVDFATESLSGVVTITFQPVGQAVTELVLDLLSDLTVTEVRWRSSYSWPLNFSREKDLLSISMPFAIPGWWTPRIEVYYEGTPQFYGFQFDETAAGRPIAASLSQPWSARSWWPCKDDPRDRATFTSTLRVPDGMTAVSNGVPVVAKAGADAGELESGTKNLYWEAKLREQGYEPGRERVFRWEETLPISTYHFSVAVSVYEQLTSTYMHGNDSFEIVHYVYPELVASATADFAVLPDMLDFCISRFGHYPFPGQRYGMTIFE